MIGDKVGVPKPGRIFIGTEASFTVTKEYVVGFCFYSPTFPKMDNFCSNVEVALIRKVKPEFQRGKWNGIGGKIEEGESDYAAMCREWKEETGTEFRAWRRFCYLNWRHYDHTERVCCFTGAGLA